MARKSNGTESTGHRGNGNPHRASKVARREQRLALRAAHIAAVETIAGVSR